MSNKEDLLRVRNSLSAMVERLKDTIEKIDEELKRV
jgi:hypothetical protein